MKTVTITLGGTEHEVKELPMRKSREWRKNFEKPFSEILDAINAAQTIEINDTKDLSKVVGQFKRLLLDSIDIVADLVIEYTGIDREWILENSYDSEIMESFVSIMGLAFPVDFLARAMGRIGAAPSTISTSGHFQNTADGLTSSAK